MTSLANRDLIEATKKASSDWQNGFNQGDAKKCADQYEPNAIMHARPFGTFTGHSEIEQFWQNLINDGFGQVEYMEPSIEVIDDRTVCLTSGWRMNKAGGVIHKELWVLQNDRTMKLKEDDFEVIDTFS